MSILKNTLLIKDDLERSNIYEIITISEGNKTQLNNNNKIFMADENELEKCLKLNEKNKLYDRGFQLANIGSKIVSY